jgi:hypothetical protein
VVREAVDEFIPEVAIDVRRDLREPLGMPLKSLPESNVNRDASGISGDFEDVLIRSYIEMLQIVGEQLFFARSASKLPRKNKRILGGEVVDEVTDSIEST